MLSNSAFSHRSRIGRQQETPAIASRSDNGCSEKLASLESQSAPKKRCPAVGLRGAKGRQYTPAERLAARTIKTPTCWIVQGYRNPGNGYVHVHAGKGTPRWSAHRLAYTVAYGPIPQDARVLHSCDNPQCVNPDHLSIGTQRDNIYDSIRKGRYNTFGQQKLNASQVHAIRRLSAAGVLQQQIASQFGIARNTVSGIVNNKSWTHLEAK